MLKGIHLRLSMGPLTFTPVPKVVIESLTDLQVSHQAGGRSGFQFTVKVGKGGAIERELLPSRFFDPPTRVVMQLVIDGQPSVLMDGVITRHDLVQSNEPGKAALSITGADVSQMMDLVDLSGVPMPPMPPVAQVAFLLARYVPYGIVPTLLPSPVVWVDNPLVRVRKQKGTDYGHITWLARKVGYAFFVRPGPVAGSNVAYWGPDVKLGEIQPALTVNFGGASNVESLSFGFDGIGKTQNFLWFRESNSGVTVPVPLPGALLNPPLGPGIIPPLKLAQLNARPDQEDKEMAKHEVAEVIAKGLAAQAQAEDVVTASGALDVARYGRLLEARKLVAVRGAGPHHDGHWYVKSVTTSMRRGQLKQSFSLVRNAHGSFTDKVAV